MHKLTYNLTFAATSEALSLEKEETFNTHEQAIERAEELYNEDSQYLLRSLNNLQIDGRDFITISEREWNSALYDYEERMTNPNHPANLAD